MNIDFSKWVGEANVELKLEKYGNKGTIRVPKQMAENYVEWRDNKGNYEYHDILFEYVRSKLLTTGSWVDMATRHPDRYPTIIVEKE